VNVGYSKNSAVWCKISIENTQSEPRETLLCFDNILLDSIAFFFDKKCLLYGDRTKSKGAFFTCYSIPLKFKAFEKKIGYVRFTKGISFIDFSFTNRPISIQNAKEKRLHILIPFFSGIVVILLLINLILFITSKRKLYLLYILTSAISLVYVLVTIGYFKNELFPNFIYVSELRIYTASFWFVAFSSFISHFLETALKQPRFHGLLSWLNMFNLLFISITFLLLIAQYNEPLKIFMTLGYINFLVTILCLIWIVIKSFKWNKSSSLYILLAFLPYLLWGIAQILGTFKLIIIGLNADYLLYITLYEAFLFGFILTKNYFEAFILNQRLDKEIILSKEQIIKTVAEVQIRERKQLANTLHDHYASQLVYINYMIESNDAENATELIRELTKSIRNLSHQIMPKSLESGAFISCLSAQVNSMNSSKLKSKIEFIHFDFPEIIELTLAHNLYLISLELISNTLKYADATLIRLEFYAYPDCFVFNFSDDGIGFDLAQTVLGFGLSTAESRIKAFNGTFDIDTAPNEGVRILISIPK
jgi:signal transduction histidine kinase